MGRTGGETVKEAGSGTIKGTFGGVTTTISCPTIKSVNPIIEGGEPTKTSAESIEYSGCSVIKPTKCAIVGGAKKEGVAATGSITLELVENTSNTKVEELIAPTTGKTYLEFMYTNKGSETCSLNGATAKLTGSTLASVAPEVDDEADEFGVTTKAEDTTKGTFTLEPASKTYVNSQGTEKEARLEVAGELFHLEGRAVEEEENAGETIEDETAKETLSLEGGADDLGFEK
jgi:hypothetical protein